jgi:hypothetical protein
LKTKEFFMLKATFATLAILSCLALCSAQDEYHKMEISAGYSHMRADGMLGSGELFSDDLDAPLSFPDSTSLLPLDPNLTANPNNLFPSSPFVNTGKRRRASLNGFNASAVYNFSKYIGVKFEVSGHYRSAVVTGGSIVTTTPWTGNALIPIQPSYTGFTVRSVIILNGTGGDTDQQHYNYLGGLQIKNNSKTKKFKPFAHALAGVSRQTVKFKEFNQRDFAVYGKDTFTNTGMAMSFGGGIDIRLSRRIDLRVIQVDYNPVKIKGQEILSFKQPISNTGIPANITFTNLPTATLYSAQEIKISNRWQNNFRIGVGVVFH